MKRSLIACGAAALLGSLAACNSDQRENIDSAAGNVVNTVQSEIAVLDVDMGRHVNAEKEVTEKTDTFGKNDTIFASVNLTGAAQPGALSAKWLFPDSSSVEQTADSGNTGRAGRAAFFIAKPGGLPVGQYTFRVLVNGRDVRSKDVTVR